MMASRSDLQYFLYQRLSFYLVALLCIVTLAFSNTETASETTITGEVGGNVTFRCPFNRKRGHNFFYFQTSDDKFVNGYHERNPVQGTWENTRLDDSETTVHMYRLNISHSGHYKCIIQYKDSPEIPSLFIQLIVTANYSKPTVTKNCNGIHCLVTCASHGGYPRTKMMLNVPDSKNNRSQTWKHVNSSEEPSPSTMLYNSSITTYFNCSSGELQYLSCSVGEVTSDLFSVCKREVAPVPNNTAIILAICAVVFMVVVVMMTVCCKCNKRHRRTAARGVIQEMRANGDEEEGNVLT